MTRHQDLNAVGVIGHLKMHHPRSLHLTASALMPAVVFRIALLFSFAILASCASSDGFGTKSSRMQSALTRPVTEAPVVAVVPFDTPNLTKLPKETQSMRQFQNIYLPTRLIKQLRATPGIGSVYFSPAPTPAADLSVKATIEKADGRTLSVNVTVLRADGSEALVRSFSLTNSSQEWAKGGDPSAKIWPQIASAIAKIPQQPGEFAVRRAGGYIKAPAKLQVNDERARLALEGAKVERERVLAPLTRNITEKAVVRGVDKKYTEWQKDSTPLIEERNRQAAQQAASVVSGLMGAVAAGYGMNSAMQNAGNPQASQVMQQSTQLMVASQQAFANAEVHGEKIKEIEKTLGQLNLNSSLVQGKSISVALYNRTFNLQGSPEKQLGQLHQVVAAKLAE